MNVMKRPSKKERKGKETMQLMSVDLRKTRENNCASLVDELIRVPLKEYNEKMIKIDFQLSS